MTNIQHPILKNSDNLVNIFKGFDNRDTRKDLITGYMRLKSYMRDATHPCTYKKLKFYTKPQIEIIQADNGCNIDFINCGNGDSCLIENSGKYALIDFGSQSGTVKKYLDKHVKGNVLEYAIVTHFHADHMSDFKNVFQNYNVKNLIIVKNTNPKIKNSTLKELAKLDNFCNASNITMLEIGNCIHNHSHNFTLGNASFEFLGPLQDLKNLNDNSIVLKMDYRDNSLLLTGDISSEAENNVIKYCINKNIDLKTNILKVAHHGSKEGSSQKFLEITKPLVSVISCNPENPHNHPEIEAVNRINKNSLHVKYTYKGDISTQITPEGELFVDGKSANLPEPKKYEFDFLKMWERFKQENPTLIQNIPTNPNLGGRLYN